MVTLRTYQDAAVADVRTAFNRDGHLRVLFVLPTGGGKTTIFSYIAARCAEAGKRVWILAHRDELLSQISRSLDSFGVRHGVMRRGSNGTWHDVQVCSVQTLVRRLNSGLTLPDMIIPDEAHHAAAGSWGKILAAFPNVPVLGVTATPCRLDGKGLGDVFDTMVIGPSPQWLTDNGYLAPAKIYAPELISTVGMHTRMGDFSQADMAEAADKPTICGDAVSHYLKLAAGKRMIVFCVNLKHVEHTVAAYESAGVPAAALDGSLSPADRAQRVADFSAARVLVLVTCDLVSEGFDVPGCDGVQMLRPTQSESLYLQQVGRALRPAPGKTHAIILDHVRNWERHGRPCDERDWELTKGNVKRKRADGAALGLRQCLECYHVYENFVRQCPACGHMPPVMDRTPDQVAGELKEIGEAAPLEPVTPEEKALLLTGRHTLKGWHEVAKRLGYSHKWAWRKHSEGQRANG